MNEWLKGLFIHYVANFMVFEKTHSCHKSCYGFPLPKPLANWRFIGHVIIETK